MTDKQFEKLLKKYGAEELADLVFPVKLSEEEKKEADVVWAEDLKKRRAEITPEWRLKGSIVQICLQIKGYINQEEIDKEKTFGSFLKSYIAVTKKTQVQFAEEISLKPTVLSQYINGHRRPSENICIRLEIHSNELIPAEYWCQLADKEKINSLRLNKELRRKQNKFVKREAS